MIEIIPAIDLIDGKCVRLSQGDFSRSVVYNERPLEVAKRFESAGLRRLHIVDLDGAKTGKLSNVKVLEEIAKDTRLTIDFGGGIRTDEDVKAVFDAGASMANVGSVAIKEAARFTSWVDHYGSNRFLLGADVRDGMLVTDAWQRETDQEIVPFLAASLAKGIRGVFVTDVSKDGVLGGPSIDLYRRIVRALPNLRLIASGGVSSAGDIAKLEEVGCSGVILGKAIYEGWIMLEELSSYAG